MPKIDHADRDHVYFMYRKTSIAALLWDYRCAVCEGKLEAVADCDPDGVVIEHTITCPACDKPAVDVKHVRTIRQEMIDFRDVLDGLPARLRAMIEQPISKADAEAAAEALYK